MHRERVRSGSITATEEVAWALALEYAAAVDLAKLNGNARELLAAGKVLEGALSRLTAEPPAPKGGGPRDSGDGGSSELYDRPPTVGDSPHS